MTFTCNAAGHAARMAGQLAGGSGGEPRVCCAKESAFMLQELAACKTVDAC